MGIEAIAAEPFRVEGWAWVVPHGEVGYFTDSTATGSLVNWVATNIDPLAKGPLRARNLLHQARDDHNRSLAGGAPDQGQGVAHRRRAAAGEVLGARSPRWGSRAGRRGRHPGLCRVASKAAPLRRDRLRHRLAGGDPRGCCAPPLKPHEGFAHRSTPSLRLSPACGRVGASLQTTQPRLGLLLPREEKPRADGA